MVEEWRPYPKNTDYQVSNLGQVKSKYNKNNVKNSKEYK